MNRDVQATDDKIRSWISWMKNVKESEMEIPAPSLNNSELWISDRANNDCEKEICEAIVSGVTMPASHLGHSIITQGEGVITFDNGDFFRGEFFGNLSTRSGTLTKISDGGLQTRGTWIDGKLEGYVDIELFGGGWRRSHYKSGVLHGLSRTFKGNFLQTNKIHVIAYYEMNRIVGKAWKGLEGNAFLYGSLDDDEEFTGRNVLYVYPDLRTGISGTFHRGRLVKGVMCSLINHAIDSRTKILHLECMPHINCNAVFKRDLASHEKISADPYMSDPWEASRVEVRISGLESSRAGEGLFAKVHIDVGEAIALFNGVRLRAARNNSLDYEEDLTFEYRIRLNSETDLDIPKGFRSLDNYRATLGHKANHSFAPNARWSRIEHPRFGLICSIVAIRNICPGDEIFVNYGLGMSDAPIWYKQLWVEHLRNVKQFSNQDILDWCGRQYAHNGRIINLPI